VTLVLAAGALIAIERNDRAMWRRLKSALNSGEVPITHGGVVGQAWRGRGSRSALIALALDSIDVEALDEDLGRRSGELLGRVRKNDVIDAALVLIAKDGDTIATSDPEDLQSLARAAGRLVNLITV
jgi:hypothetical protein